MNIRERFNPNTRLALEAENEDYVSKDDDENALIEKIKRENGLERVYRFDIGKNTDGYSDLITEVISQVDLPELCRQNLIDYPDNHYHLLRNRLAELHGLRPDCFALSAGLESMIDHICRVFLAPGDDFLVPIPNFSVFAAFSLRLGARPLYVPLAPEDDFQWTDAVVAKLEETIRDFSPKLLWISNPVNPTGQNLPLGWMEALAAACSKNNAALVVDEAYGEYTDDDDGVVSASRFTRRYDNLMVLRTFSKIHALPSLRVGYMICGNRDILRAVDVYRPMFPFSWFSLFLARIASIDDEHLQAARQRTTARRQRLREQLGDLPNFQYIPSQTNTLMIRHRRLAAGELWRRLAGGGFLTADLGRVNGLQGRDFLRMTVRAEEENDLFVACCRRIEEASKA
jgi:histidinol-phosphate aminotransferase